MVVNSLEICILIPVFRLNLSKSDLCFVKNLGSCIQSSCISVINHFAKHRKNEEWIYILNFPNKKIYQLHIHALFQYLYYHSYPKSKCFKNALFKMNTSWKLLLKTIKSILIHEYQHRSTQANPNQHKSTRINTSLTRINTSLTRATRVRHGSTRVNRNQHKSDTSQHESTPVRHESTRINTSLKQV